MLSVIILHMISQCGEHIIAESVLPNIRDGAQFLDIRFSFFIIAAFVEKDGSRKQEEWIILILRISLKEFLKVFLFLQNGKNRGKMIPALQAVMMVNNLRAPMLSLFEFIWQAIWLILCNAESVNWSSTPSVFSSCWYCLVMAFSGSVRMRKKSSSFSSDNSTLKGNLPCSSGIKSLGLDTCQEHTGAWAKKTIITTDDQSGQDGHQKLVPAGFSLPEIRLDQRQYSDDRYEEQQEPLQV